MLTQKNKNVALIIGFALFLIIAYRFSFSNTMALHKTVSVLEAKEEVNRLAPVQLAGLRRKEKRLDEILDKNNVEGHTLQNNILKTLNQLSAIHGFKITNFEEPHMYNDPGTNKITTTYDFTLQGSYTALISVIYELEQKYSYGNVVQVKFLKKKNYKSGKSFLQCNLLLQRIS